LALPPPDSDEFILLARRVGCTTDDLQARTRHLKTDGEEQMRKTGELFERTFGAVE
jgi:glutamate-ammonia-ligase adenylyltransferase